MASPSAPPCRDGEAIAKIETVIQGIVDSLAREDTISIPLRCKKKASSSAFADREDAATISYTNVSWPAKTPAEAKRFTVLLRILDLVHEALINDSVVSKRNIYYQDPSLFGSQAVVDRYVDILAYTFGLQRADLHVTAAAKGLIAGVYVIARPDGTYETMGEDGQSHLIIDSSKVRTVKPINCQWILVVEKESTFRTLVSSNLHGICRAGMGIMLTAKGYPDISTRSFLHKLSTSTDDGMPSPSVLALTDFDPDGIAIMSTYKHGSQQLSHETEKLKVPSIQWLGIKSANVKHNIDRMDDHDSQGLLSLSLRDRKKAVKMLENNVVFAEDGSEQEWRRELQVLMMLGAKAEMEILDERSEGLAEWVEQKLEEQVQASREWYTNVSVGAPESLDMDMGLELLEGS